MKNKPDRSKSSPSSASSGGGKDPKPKGSAEKKPAPVIRVDATPDGEPPAYREFPGPAQADAPLRVAMTRDALGNVTYHARESLDAEICGVLVGDVFEDDKGIYVYVENAIAGTAARTGATHVTFTHDTWTQIHQHLEHDFPGRRIVGWYHSHPGFGVEFSEMDLFIQRNFFPAPYQVALVTDPLGGETALCVIRKDTVIYLDRFWVEGKEMRCRVPRVRPTAESGAAASGDKGAKRNSADTDSVDLVDIEERLAKAETRLQQVLQVVEDQRTGLYRFLFGMGIFLGLSLLLYFGGNFYLSWMRRFEPPKVQSMVPVPVKIGDRTVMLGVAITTWDIPEELDFARQLEKEIRRSVEEEYQKRLLEAEMQRRGLHPSATPATPDDDSGTR